MVSKMQRHEHFGTSWINTVVATLFTVIHMAAVFALDAMPGDTVAVSSPVVELTSANFKEIKENAQVLFVAFSAEWCPYSRRLKPIFHEAAAVWHKTRGPNAGVVWATLNSQAEDKLASRYGVEKYPTLKVFISGVLMPYEFRGSRNVEELNAFVDEQLKPNIRDLDAAAASGTSAAAFDAAARLASGKRHVIAYMDCADCLALKIYRKVASFLRKDCEFWLATRRLDDGTPAAIFFRESDVDDGEAKFSGNFDDYEYVKNWLSDKCVPLVREVTFDNVEELTEENIPFLLFFRQPSDKASEKLFKEVRALINPLLADGEKFAHPLKHLGKTAADLPVLAIDSFQHMFLFDKMSDLPVPGKLRQFVLDLHSGELHKNFHVTLQQRLAELQNAALKELEDAAAAGSQRDGNARPPAARPPSDLPPTVATTLPQSVFKKLRPSEKRYSLLDKQEL